MHLLVDARVLNYGTRIDYIFADLKLGLKACEECVVLQDMQGSDHCPVKATFNCELLPCKRCPPLCTKYMPEFIGKQQKLDLYFKKASASADGNEKPQRKENVIDSSSSSTQSDSAKDSTSQKESSLKRQGSDPPKGAIAKKLKKDNKQPSSRKQANLMSFFSTKNSKQESERKVENTAKNIEHNTNSNIQTSNNDTEKPDSDTTEPKRTQSQTFTVNSWKNILKPRPPPLCKGHNEPCVARTVKKDGLNKGRVFYVCTKPDGPKTNPEARCDHFEWQDKKKR